jgi:pimeloyl-ACP methyl ester carboxylesterase
LALIRLDHAPETAKACFPLYVIPPDPGQMGDLPLQKRNLLNFLHGSSGDGSAWDQYSNTVTLAHDYGLVVGMPFLRLRFYADRPNRQLFFPYLTKNLPQYLEYLLGLALRKEDAFIVGNSMRSYGTSNAAFHSPERFSV